jgi:gliding motility-associated-like protein
MQYGTNAVAARDNLTTSKGWTISGDTPSGTVCSSVPVPTITSFSPVSGPIGATVTITGTNFSTTPANNTVSFNGTLTNANASTTTSINTTVPVGATPGPIAVTVGGLTVTSSTHFIVQSAANQPPVIETLVVQAAAGASVAVDLVALASDPDNNFDPNSFSVVIPPVSGAAFSISSGVLTLDYQGVSFAGLDLLTIEGCDLAVSCVQQQLSVEVGEGLIIYNAVSPNEDGKNDVFLLQNIETTADLKENKVTIFNRWGSVVFETTNYNNTDKVFRGQNNNGGDLPPGTYYYSIEFSSGAPKRTGFISLRK